MAEFCRDCFIKYLGPSKIEVDRIVMSDNRVLCEGCGEVTNVVNRIIEPIKYGHSPITPENPHGGMYEIIETPEHSRAYTDGFLAGLRAGYTNGQNSIINSLKGLCDFCRYCKPRFDSEECSKCMWINGSGDEDMWKFDDRALEYDE